VGWINGRADEPRALLSGIASDALGLPCL